MWLEVHNLTATRDLEPLGGAFVRLHFGHDVPLQSY